MEQTMFTCLLRKHCFEELSTAALYTKFWEVAMPAVLSPLICPCPPLLFDRVKPEGPRDPSWTNQSLVWGRASRSLGEVVMQTGHLALGLAATSSMCVRERRKPCCRKQRIKQMDGEKWMRAHGYRERGLQTERHTQTLKYKLHLILRHASPGP